jgi:hypothetical protein
MLKEPTKIEQFEALLNAKAFELAKQYCEEGRSISECYRTTFTIKRKEFLAYVKENYRLSDLPFTRSKISNKDAFYILKGTGNKYRIYYQEKLAHMNECFVIGQDAAYEKYIEHCLKCSGTGLPLDWWE